MYIKTDCCEFFCLLRGWFLLVRNLALYCSLPLTEASEGERGKTEIQNFCQSFRGTSEWGPGSVSLCLSENISDIVDQENDAGKTRIREMPEESKGRNMVGDWNPQRNVASEKSPGAHCLKSLLELERPVFNSKLSMFLQLNPLPTLFKTSVNFAVHKCLGWSKENQEKEMNLNPGWHRTKERRESLAVNVNEHTYHGSKNHELQMIMGIETQ